MIECWVLHDPGPKLGEVRVLGHLENGSKVLVSLWYVFTSVVALYFGFCCRLYWLRHLLRNPVHEVLEGAVSVAESSC